MAADDDELNLKVGMHAMQCNNIMILNYEKINLLHILILNIIHKYNFISLRMFYKILYYIILRKINFKIFVTNICM